MVTFAALGCTDSTIAFSELAFVAVMVPVAGVVALPANVYVNVFTPGTVMT